MSTKAKPPKTGQRITVKRYEPSRMWVVVCDTWRATKLSNVALGLAKGGDDKTERLYGVCFVACFRTRALCRYFIKKLPEPWPGLRIVEVLLSEAQ